MRYSRALMTTFLILTHIGCAFNDKRDYQLVMDPDRVDDPLFIPSEDFEITPGDQGRYYRSEKTMYSRTPASYGFQKSEKFQNSLNKELNGLVEKLPDREYQQYLAVEKKMTTNSEKIYFLGLNEREKKDYIRAINPEKDALHDSYDRNSNEITLGMKKNHVRRIWGMPMHTDKGNRGNGSERWAYNRDGRVKYIYFEQDQVDGWLEE